MLLLIKNEVFLLLFIICDNKFVVEVLLCVLVIVIEVYWLIICFKKLL